MGTEKNLFSLKRNTRQTAEDMNRELKAFRRYWRAKNKGHAKVPVKAEDYMKWADRRFHKDTLTRFFGGWDKVCEAADMKVWKTHEYNDEDIIDLVLDLWRFRRANEISVKTDEDKGCNFDGPGGFFYDRPPQTAWSRC